MHNGARTSLGPSATGCLALGLEKIRQSKMVSVGRGTGDETSLSTAITNPQSTWDQTAVKSRAASPQDLLALGSVVPCLETQVAPSLGSFQAFERASGSQHGTEKEKGMEGQGSY